MKRRKCAQGRLCCPLQAQALGTSSEQLQGELDCAVEALEDQASLVDALTQKLASVMDTISYFDNELTVR